ncbi:MAG: NAD(P)/FAD-dependent oxidoreductase [Candidatus Woesearchaeota archaeon]
MISVIGAGVSGTSAARELSKHFDVNIFEKNRSPYKTCSSILTYKIEEVEKIPKKLIRTRIKTAKIHAPNGKILEINFKKPDIVFNRQELNQYFADKAVDAGANLFMEHEFVHTNYKSVAIKDKKNKKIKDFKVEYLIGADGANSNVAKQVDLFGKRRFFIGIKAELKSKNDNTINFFPYIKDFAWQSPIDEETIEIGVCAERKAKESFDLIIKKFSGRIIKKEAAIIPIWNPKQLLQRNNVLLVGDAGTINKATTGGGIIYGIISGRIAAKEIINTKKTNRKLKNKLNYENELRKKLGKNLWVHLKIRNILNKFSEKDWNDLINKFQNPKLKQILATESRDYPLKFTGKMLISDISLIKYIAKMIL